MQLQRYYDVSQAPDIEDFRWHLSQVAADMGFGLFSAFLVIENPVDKKAPLVHGVNNVPHSLATVLNDRDLVERDPLIHRLKTLSVPVSYDQHLYIREHAADIWEMQASYGYKTGISVALHLPDRQHFVLGLDRDKPLPSSQERLSRRMADLQLLAAHSLVAATRLMHPTLQRRLPKLSNRELEALKWTLEGKTAWEIGRLLGISERTVVFHLNNGIRKLGAINKHQAALKALQFGLIH